MRQSSQASTLSISTQDWQPALVCRSADCIPGSQQWEYGPWSQCSHSCGIGSTNRTATCTLAPGVPAFSSTQAPAPSQTVAMGPSSQRTAASLQPCGSALNAMPANIVQQCSIASCKLNSWEVEDWSACNATCGGDKPFPAVTCIAPVFRRIISKGLIPTAQIWQSLPMNKPATLGTRSM